MYLHILNQIFVIYPPLPPSLGYKTPNPDIPKIQNLQIIWENNCCDYVFQPNLKNDSFFERAKITAVIKNIIIYSYYGKIGIFAKKVLKKYLKYCFWGKNE